MTSEQLKLQQFQKEISDVTKKHGIKMAFNIAAITDDNHKIISMTMDKSGDMYDLMKMLDLAQDNIPGFREMFFFLHKTKNIVSKKNEVKIIPLNEEGNICE